MAYAWSSNWQKCKNYTLGFDKVRALLEESEFPDAWVAIYVVSFRLSVDNVFFQLLFVVYACMFFYESKFLWLERIKRRIKWLFFTVVQVEDIGSSCHDQGMVGFPSGRGSFKYSIHYVEGLTNVPLPEWFPNLATNGLYSIGCSQLLSQIFSVRLEVELLFVRIVFS